MTQVSPNQQGLQDYANKVSGWVGKRLKLLRGFVRRKIKTSVSAFIEMSVVVQEWKFRYLWKVNLVLNFYLETCTVKCALLAESKHYSNFLGLFLQLLVKMPAEDCCKLVKKEIPSIDEDLYSYIESELVLKELWALLVLTLSSWKFSLEMPSLFDEESAFFEALAHC